MSVQIYIRHILHSFQGLENTEKSRLKSSGIKRQGEGLQNTIFGVYKDGIHTAIATTESQNMFMFALDLHETEPINSQTGVEKGLGGHASH